MSVRPDVKHCPRCGEALLADELCRRQSRFDVDVLHPSTVLGPIAIWYCPPCNLVVDPRALSIAA